MKKSLKIEKNMYEKLYEIHKDTLNEIECELMHINTKEEKKKLCELYLRTFEMKEVVKKMIEEKNEKIQIEEMEEEVK